MKRALGACLAFALAGAGCGSTAKDEPSSAPITDTLLELDLVDPLAEQTVELFGEERPGVAAATTRVRKLLDEPLTKGLFVRLGPAQGRLADVDEWAALFDAFRAKKKPVHCHFDGLDNAGYALASHCDRLTMSPSATLELVGLAVQVVHGRALLEMLGVEADLMQMGKYKGAAEPFTRDTMSDELRASLDGLLDDLEARFHAHLGTRHTKPSHEDIDARLDGGPYTAPDAAKAGLVDAVGYDDEARQVAKTAANARVVKKLFEPREAQSFSLRDVIEALGEPEKKRIGRPHMALVHLTGEIVDAEREGLDRVSGTPFVKAMRRLGDDSDVRAVVLRIESPGGSALASDRMWHAVRRVAKRKPVIVSLGDMAASGGYYVASAGTHIIAAPSSIVGSIGVVGGKMVLKGLAEKVGVHVDTIERSKHATWLSPFAPFEDSERRTFEHMLRDTYDRFLARVAEGRGRKVEEILPAAEGRVMGGDRALQLGLVDEVGSLARAFDVARERGKLPKDAPVTTWPEHTNPLEALSTLVGGADARAASLPGAVEAVAPLSHSLTQGALVEVLLRQHAPLATVVPFALSVR